MNSPGRELDAEARARRLLEPGAEPYVPVSVQQLTDIAWAIKDLCYVAWSTEPSLAARAGEVLDGLLLNCPLEQGTSDFTSEDKAALLEARALADWTLGIGHLTRGEMGPAIDCFDSSAEGFRGLGENAHAAQTQVPKIMALSMLGRYQDATDCAHQARQVFEQVGDTRSAGKVSLNLGALHERIGAYAEAARESRSAAVLFARVGDRELSIMADINSGHALCALGDFNAALGVYARAEMRAAKRDYPVLESLAEESAALVMLARGEYRTALAGMEKARRRYESLDMPQYLATAEKQLGDAYLDLRLLPEAAALFQHAIKRFGELQFPDEQAWALLQLGRSHALQGSYDHARHSLQKANELFDQQELQIGSAAVNLAMSELCLSTGEPQQAQALAQFAADAFEEAGQLEGQVRAETSRAEALLAAGDTDGAGKLFKATLARSEELQLLPQQTRCLTGAGLADWSMGNRETARATLAKAIECAEEQRQALPGDDLRIAFFSDQLRPYQAMLEIALDEHDAHPGEAVATEVLLQLDRVRARALGDRLGHQLKQQPDHETQALRDRLNWLYREARRKEQDGESAQVLKQESRDVELQLLEQARRARLTESVPAVDTTAYKGAEQETIEFSPALLQACMDNGDALVSYGASGDEVFACVLTKTGLELRRGLASWSEVLRTLSAVRFQIDSLSHGSTQLEAHADTLRHRIEAHLEKMHSLVWSPIASLLENCSRVLVVPHAQLGWLPFGALHHDGAPLAEHLQLVVVPSTHLALRGYQRQPLPSRQLLALGESSQLPHAAREALFISRLFQDSKVLTGDEATLRALEAHASKADILHIACHAQFRADNPLFSSLHLADGPLTVEMAETLSLRRGLVVLSACETGVVEHRGGDEMVGLVRAFLIAGSARVLASAWRINDEATARFMEQFYRSRAGGRSSAEALRDAQIKIRKDSPHPYYWAGFSLYGGF